MLTGEPTSGGACAGTADAGYNDGGDNVGVGCGVTSGVQTCGLGCGSGGRVLHSMLAKSQSPHSPGISRSLTKRLFTTKPLSIEQHQPIMTLPSLPSLTSDAKLNLSFPCYISQFTPLLTNYDTSIFGFTEW